MVKKMRPSAHGDGLEAAPPEGEVPLCTVRPSRGGLLIQIKGTAEGQKMRPSIRVGGLKETPMIRDAG